MEKFSWVINQFCLNNDIKKMFDIWYNGILKLHVSAGLQ